MAKALENIPVIYLRGFPPTVLGENPNKIGVIMVAAHHEAE